MGYEIILLTHGRDLPYYIGRDSLVLTSLPSRHRTRTTKETFEDRHVPCTLTRDSHFPRMGDAFLLTAHETEGV